jgi:lipoprotein-releasing system permease protein
MYKILLILKYLRRRRIAWVSLIAVTMCTALMLIVISVMGGWLRMFRQSFHGLSGDVIVEATSMQGFPFYGEMLKQIDALDFVGPGHAVPVLRAFGLVNLNGQQTKGVEVAGYPIDIISNVNDFDGSLYRQHISRVEAKAKLADPKLHLTAQERKYFTELADDHTPPSFALAKTAGIKVFPDELPPDLKIPADLQDKLFYLPSEQTMLYRGEMSDADFARLMAVSSDPAYQDAIQTLYHFSDPRRMFRKTVDISNWSGMILGDGVASIYKDDTGKVVGRDPSLWRIKAELMVAAVQVEGSLPSLENAPPVRPYWIVDDSRTKVYQIDSSTVYVPFDILQQDLRMTEEKSEDGSKTYPARTSEIDIRVTPGTDLNDVRTKIARICERITDEQMASGKFVLVNGTFNVQTWEQRNSLFLGAVEHEEVLMLFLFGLISVVAVFLIFCIFYMIVVEKTRDIGIVKSVGATSGGVAGIFLGYGLAIGLVGSGLGLLFGWIIIHYINQIHAWMGRALHIVIWDPKVYLFDTIPNTMNPKEVVVICSVAVLAAVLGALLPAIRAASLHPVESLRWE